MARLGVRLQMPTCVKYLSYHATYTQWLISKIQGATVYSKAHGYTSSFLICVIDVIDNYN